MAMLWATEWVRKNNNCQIITCPLDAALEKTNHLDRVIGQLLGTSLIGCNMMGQNTHLST